MGVGSLQEMAGGRGLPMTSILDPGLESCHVDPACTGVARAWDSVSSYLG